MGGHRFSAMGRRQGSTLGQIRKCLLITGFLCCWLFLRVPAGATLQSLHVGATAPDFSLQDLTGRQRTFAELKGEKLTVVIFWSTWSRNSEKGLASLQNLYARFREHGLAVLAVNADGQDIQAGKVAEITALAEKLGLEFPMLLDQGLAAFHHYGIIALPSTVVLDPERNIRYELSGYPLIGSGEMLEFIAAAMEGKESRESGGSKGYQPDKAAVRLYNMGQSSLASKRTAASAESWFKKAAAADPGFVQPRISLGRLYAERGEPALAREQFALALQKEPANAVALCGLGMVMVSEGKLDEGRTLLEKALQGEESHTPCFYYLGYAYGKGGKLEEALAMFENALAINRVDLDIYVHKGRMLEENGRLAEAVEAYRQALAQALTNKAAK